MGYYWESHLKQFNGYRLLWYGNAPSEEFWTDYWEKAVIGDYFSTLSMESLKKTAQGKCLLRELKTTDRILEAGCGIGKWVAFLGANGFTDVLGIDYSQEVVGILNSKNPNLNIKWGDALNIQAVDNSFDAYLSFGVVEHLFPGPEPFLKEAYRVIKPSGKAIFTVPCVGPLRKFKGKAGKYRDHVEGIPFFQFGFQKLEFTNMLQLCGFKIENSSYLELDRLLLEEVKQYRSWAKYNSIRVIEKLISDLFEQIDGHMLMVVCTKPES